ncbi:MAG TPA: hypothetical protein DGG94_02275 [Micromonosporaceae bacterium]|nr:hypothetical protein [Micromonosporaceae bacterium]HCU48650.1 hypothetical protein [Micromonosporaceae bacterium]
MFWAMVSYLVTTLGTVLTNYLTSANITPLQGTLISTGVGLVVVLIGVLIDQAKQGGVKQVGAQQLPLPPQPEQPYRQPRQRGTMSWVAAVLVILLLCGGGGLAVAYGAQWVGSKVLGFVDPTHGPKTQRLASSVTKKSGGLTVTVSSVELTERATLITVTATYVGKASVTMPTCQLTVPGANSLQHLPLDGDWEEGTVPVGGERTGVIVFDGVIGPKVSKVTLAFTQIFSQDFDAPRNIAVDLVLTTS